jgi:hypothetical protein
MSGLSFSSSDKIQVSGVVMSISGHAPIAAAAIIQSFQGMGGGTNKDTAFSDSVGRFTMALLDSTLFAHPLLVEKDGYKTQTVMVPPTATQAIRLDTIFLVQYSLLDTVTYSMSGTVTDAMDEAVKGAAVSVILSRGTTDLYSVNTSTSQWGGYFSASTRQPFLAAPLTAHIRVEKPGFVSLETSHTLASSSQNFVFTVTLNRSAVPVVPHAASAAAVRPQNSALSRTWTIDGRICRATGQGTAQKIVVRASAGGKAGLMVRPQ